MLLRDLPDHDAQVAARHREGNDLCIWCGVALPEDAAWNRSTCTRAHNKALSRWRLGEGTSPRTPTCDTCGATIERNGRRGRLPDRCDGCKPTSGTPRPGRWKHRPGDRFDSLTLVERLGDGRALFQCDCGNVRQMSIGNVTNGTTTNCTDRAAHPDPRLVHVPAYATAHTRVEKVKGRARDHECEAPGCRRAAHDWAYRHGLVDPLVQERGTKDDGNPYADDPALYMAFCRAHHQAWDNAWLKQTANASGISLAHVSAFQATT